MDDRAKDEYQPLWAVNPGVLVEGGPLPQACDLSIPALVRRQRRAEERQAGRDGEEDRDDRSERWGPPRAEIDRTTAVLAALAFAAAFAGALALVGLSLPPDRMLVVLLAPVLVLRRVRRYLLDFVPFALLIFIYAEARGLAHTLRPDPYYLPQIDAEKLLFAGSLPPVVVQDWLWSGVIRSFDAVVVDVTRIHSIVPPLLAFALWLKRRALFYRFAASILALSFAGAVTFLVFPAAPPWAAAERGLIEPVTRLTTLKENPSSLSPDAGTTSVYHLADPNPYAAIPSLHGGYAFLVFLFVATLTWKTRWRWLGLAAGIYPALQGFAAVYTGNHYVVDLVIGFAYATAALFGVRWFWRRRGWPE